MYMYLPAEPKLVQNKLLAKLSPEDSGVRLIGAFLQWKYHCLISVFVQNRSLRLAYSECAQEYLFLRKHA